jgi:putative phosphoribosyl transferase
MRFDDRRHAGKVLAEMVADARPESPVVLALPRGGVPVAYEVSQALGCPLDVLVVKKVGVPGQPELAMGAVGEQGVTIVHRPVVSAVGVSGPALEAAIDQSRADLEAAVGRYRPEKPPEEIEGRTAVIVDDGLATGSTARAAVAVARARGAGSVWLAAPVAPPSTVAEMSGLVDRLLIPSRPRRFVAVGNWYRDFRQTTDAEVVSMLRGDG